MNFCDETKFVTMDEKFLVFFLHHIIYNTIYKSLQPTWYITTNDKFHQTLFINNNNKKCDDDGTVSYG